MRGGTRQRVDQRMGRGQGGKGDGMDLDIMSRLTQLLEVLGDLFLDQLLAGGAGKLLGRLGGATLPGNLGALRLETQGDARKVQSGLTSGEDSSGEETGLGLTDQTQAGGAKR